MQVHTLHSPFGPLTLFGSDGALVALEWGQVGETNPDAVLLEAERQLTRYFSGDFQPFTVPLDPGGTEFQREIWDAMSKIPVGATLTYGALAEKAGHPKASRAVGTACARNPLPLFIPCHRVLRGDGALGNYSGGEGPATKQQLLVLEGALVL